MKRTNFPLLFWGAVLCLLVVGACQKSTFKENPTKNTSTQSLVDRFNICRNFARYHSKALEEVYNKGMRGINTSETPFSQSISMKSAKVWIDNFLSSNMVQENLSKSYSQFITASGTNELRAGQSVDTLKMARFRNKIYNETYKAGLSVNVSEIIQKSLEDPSLKLMNTVEQNAILIQLAIYEDSQTYWRENFAKWVLTKPALQKARKGMDGDGKGFGSWLSKAWTTICKVAEADVEGPKTSHVVGAALGGAAAGGLGGAAAAGVGAVPGAAAGFVAGGVGTLVGEAATSSVEAASNTGNNGNAAGGSPNPNPNPNPKK